MRGNNVVLIIPLVLFEKFRNSIIPLKKKKLNKIKKSFFSGQRQPPLYYFPERDWGVESREWLHYIPKTKFMLRWSSHPIFFVKVRLLNHSCCHLFLSHFCSKIIGKKKQQQQKKKPRKFAKRDWIAYGVTIRLEVIQKAGLLGTARPLRKVLSI